MYTNRTWVKKTPSRDLHRSEKQRVHREQLRRARTGRRGKAGR